MLKSILDLYVTFNRNILYFPAEWYSFLVFVENQVIFDTLKNFYNSNLIGPMLRAAISDNSFLFGKFRVIHVSSYIFSKPIENKPLLEFFMNFEYLTWRSRPHWYLFLDFLKDQVILGNLKKIYSSDLIVEMLRNVINDNSFLFGKFRVSPLDVQTFLEPVDIKPLSAIKDKSTSIYFDSYPATNSISSSSGTKIFMNKNADFVRSGKSLLYPRPIKDPWVFNYFDIDKEYKDPYNLSYNFFTEIFSGVNYKCPYFKPIDTSTFMFTNPEIFLNNKKLPVEGEWDFFKNNKLIHYRTNSEVGDFVCLLFSTMYFDLIWDSFLHNFDYGYFFPKDLLPRNYSDFNFIHRNNLYSWRNYDDFGFSNALDRGGWVFVREESREGRDVYRVSWKSQNPLIQYPCFAHLEQMPTVAPILEEYFTSVKDWEKTILDVKKADYSNFLRKKQEILKALDYNHFAEIKLRYKLRYKPRLSWRYLTPKNEAYFNKIFSEWMTYN